MPRWRSEATAAIGNSDHRSVLARVGVWPADAVRPRLAPPVGCDLPRDGPATSGPPSNAPSARTWQCWTRAGSRRTVGEPARRHPDCRRPHHGFPPAAPWIAAGRTMDCRRPHHGLPPDEPRAPTRSTRARKALRNISCLWALLHYRCRHNRRVTGHRITGVNPRDVFRCHQNSLV